MGNKLIKRLCISDDANNHYGGKYNSNDDSFDLNELNIHSNYKKSLDDDDDNNNNDNDSVQGYWRDDNDNNSSISSLDDYDVAAVNTDTDSNTNGFNIHKDQVSEFLSSLQSPSTHRKSISQSIITHDQEADDTSIHLAEFDATVDAQHVNSQDKDDNIDNINDIDDLDDLDNRTVSTYVIKNNKSYIITRENVKALSSVCQMVTGKRFSQFKTVY